MAIILSSVTFGQKNDVLAHAEARNSLSNATLTSVDVPDTDGYIISVLCETDTAAYFAESEASPKNVQKRNFHLELETGAILGALGVPSLYDAAKNDVLSGTYSYDLYAAKASGLARLLSFGVLEDVSENKYIDTESELFDGHIMDTLAVLGKHHFISSPITDSYSEITVLAYDSAICDGTTLRKAVAGGTLTYESLLTEAAFLDVGREDVYPLYVSVNGPFASAAEELEITALADVKNGLETLSALTVRSSLLNTATLDSGEAYSVMKLSEAKALRSSGLDLGILPMPKMNVEDEYRNYIDIANTVLLSIPRGHSDLDKISYIVYRLAFLSDGYTLPSYYAAFDADDRGILRLISASTVCDMSNLFGYGGIDKLISEAATKGNDRLTLDYYNRKTLYEKAFEIIENRLNSDIKQ